MALPILITYSQANLNSIKDDSSKVLKELSGKHVCHFYYSEPHKSFKKVRISVDDLEWNMIVEIGKDHLCFSNPWFRKAKFLSPVKEEDAKIVECEILFDNRKLSPSNVLILTGKANAIGDIFEFVQSCERLTKPVTPLDKDKEKEIWTAYCDGLTALSKERREFLNVDYAGKPILYNDTRIGDIYTMKIGIGAASFDQVPSHVEKMLNDKYRIDVVSFNEDASQLNIAFKGTEKIVDDDIEELSDFLHDYGYTLPNDGIINVLKVSVACAAFKKRVDLYDKLDAKLEESGILFSNNESLEYILSTDEDVTAFFDIVSTVFGELGHAVKNDTIKVDLELDDELISSIHKEISDTSKMGVSRHAFKIIPDNRTEYIKLKEEAQQILKRHNLECVIPDYYTICKVQAQGAEAEYRRQVMSKAEEALSDFRRISYRYEYDSEQARVMRFEFKFRSSEERENIIEQFSATVESLGNSYRMVLKHRLGATRVKFLKDDALIQRLEDEFRVSYQNEEIKLVAGKVYRDLFRNVTDPDNIIDPVLREQYNRFMNECPIIGTCHKRTVDSIIVRLSEDFFDGQEFEQSIRKGDMVFFPAVGTSTDLRRQYDAIQRINRPGQSVNGRRIEPPVNPQLCSFLFDPMFAHDIHEDIESMMNTVNSNRLEQNLNRKQVEAVAKAVLAKDIAFIQGPPGTGKTTVIAEIIWQEIRRNHKCRILLTSQTNLAVDNALERLKYKRSIRPLRVISDQRVDNDEMIYNINLLDTWVKEPNDYNKNNVVERWIDSITERIERNKDLSDITKDWHDVLVKKDKSIRKEFVDLYKSNVNLIAATCSICGSRIFRQMYEKMYDTDEVAFDVVIMDEASKATPLEMAIPMVLGKKIIVIGDHKQLPPVLDEKSIDTALKKIGREDLANKILDLKESQFKKLFLLCQKFKPNLITTLDTQYRMHKDIMMTVNQFYVDELGENGLKCGIESVMNVPDFKNRGSRWHGITYEPFITPSTHAIWVNVEGNEEKVYTSFKNDSEIKAVQTVVKALVQADGFRDYIHAQEKMEDKEIGIITFYSAQRRELKNLEQNGLLDRYNDYRIEVVDRFQGMERNIVIVSTVRSNKYNGIGFAKEIERINVAFSRARSLLVVIGNRDLFYTKYNYRKSIDAMECIDIKQIEDLLRNEQ